MEDKILTMFFEKKRWEDALNKGAVKGIRQPILRELMSPEGRFNMLTMVLSGQYHIERPHTAKIPKDTPGEFRTVFVNGDMDRIFLSLVNDLLFEIAGDMVHPQCTSYQKGIGCGKIVTKASQRITLESGGYHQIVGWKSDLSKYFDSVPIRFIDAAFDKVEEKFGHSLIIDIVREYYHNDLYFDSELKQEVTHYQSLKQGCAVASWLADVVLYDIDNKLSNLNGYYVRYSDDTLFIGKDYKEAMTIMSDELSWMEMKLNPKKVEYITNDKWFKFLGYAIKGDNISLSSNRLKTFTNEISKRTIREIRHNQKYATALKNVMSWLYYGDGNRSWATGVLSIINSKSDILKLNSFVMDCLAAVKVGKSVSMADIGGLGWVKNGKDGCIQRGKGKKVRTLRNHTSEENGLDGYYTLTCMRNALVWSRDVYDSIVRTIL